jgi:hypothetical protein
MTTTTKTADHYLLVEYVIGDDQPQAMTMMHDLFDAQAEAEAINAQPDDLRAKVKVVFTDGTDLFV